MEQEKINQIKKLIEDADQVLIGIGEAFDCLPAQPENTGIGRQYIENRRAAGLEEELFEEERTCLSVLAAKEWTEKRERVQKAYELLYEMVKEKPHFVVTMNVDDAIYDSSFAREQIVAPCGSMEMLQCHQHILEPFETEPIIQELTEAVKSGGIFEGAGEGNGISYPRCPVCEGLLRPNTIRTEGYLEDAYLPQWKAYTGWLSRTLNKKLVVLELGVSFAHPSVFRFPAEKTVFYNKQATLVRVNERFYQIPEEMKEKGIALKEHAVDFVFGLKGEEGHDSNHRL